MKRFVAWFFEGWPNGGEIPIMSLRDWFAGQAIAAISSRWSGRIGDLDAAAAGLTARKAYEIADAMLEARKR